MRGASCQLQDAKLVYADGRIVVGGLTCVDGVIRDVFAGEPTATPGNCEVIDAGGRYVLPGLIDPHVQLYPADDFGHYASETRSAALGGVTTIVKMHRDLDGYPCDAFDAELAGAERRALVDFSFHLALMTARQIEDVASLARDLELTSFKLFMAYKGDEGHRIGIQGVDDGLLLDAFRAIGELGGVALVHCENQELAERAMLSARAADDDLRAFEASRPWYVEAEAVRRALFLAEVASCPLYVVHVTSRRTLDFLAGEKRRGARVWVETEPHYLTETFETPARVLAKVIPPLREGADSEALWDAAASGIVDTIGSDHVAAARAPKQGSVWDAQLAFPGIATILPVLLSYGVATGRLSLARVVALTSTRPAAIFGFEAKGTLEPGRDGDFVVVDLDEERVVDAALLGSSSDFSIYEGRRLRGWPVLTVSRGRVVARDGEVVADEGWGRYLRRSVRLAA